MCECDASEELPGTRRWGDDTARGGGAEVMLGGMSGGVSEYGGGLLLGALIVLTEGRRSRARVRRVPPKVCDRGRGAGLLRGGDEGKEQVEADAGATKLPPGGRPGLECSASGVNCRLAPTECAHKRRGSGLAVAGSRGCSASAWSSPVETTSTQECCPYGGGSCKLRSPYRFGGFRLEDIVFVGNGDEEPKTHRRYMAICASPLSACDRR